ncbi:hypothetical protein HYQ46_004974 [Verticillium longisporum]|nr:hypothetical protein HYQ46_004974 [Verticillium longisporum]
MVPSLQIDQILDPACSRVQIWALGSIRLIFRLVWPVLKEIKTCVHLAEQQRRRETWQREPKQREAQKQEAELRKSTAREESKRSAKTQSTTTSQNEGGQHRHYKTPSSCQHMRWWNRKFHQRAFLQYEGEESTSLQHCIMSAVSCCAPQQRED